MDLSGKQSLLSANNIIKIALNHSRNILACQIETSQNINFYQITPSTQFQPIFNQSSKPLSLISALSWSPNGNLLALGLTKVQIWSINHHQLAYSKYFNQQFVEIRSIVWTNDSTRYAIIGIHKSFSIIIRNIATGELKTIALDCIVSSICFDPFGKYMVCLLNNNSICIYNNSYQVCKNINLSDRQSKFMTVKQNRIMDWSPNYSEFMCPSLQDNKLPLAISFSRRNFDLKHIYMGHCSPINCLKYNPKIYQYENQLTQIVAMGDTGGIITIWRISKSNHYQHPLLLIKSHPKSDQLIQQIEWDSTGMILFANTRKRYLIIYHFHPNTFGRPISSTQLHQYLQQQYGTLHPNLQTNQLKTYSLGTRQPSNHSISSTPNNKQQLTKTQLTKPQPNKAEFIKTQMKIQIGQNHKKHIIPSMIIQKKNQQPIIQKQYIINLKLKHIAKDFKYKNIYKITSNTLIEIKTTTNNNTKIIILQLFQIIDKPQQNNNQKVFKQQRAFQGQIEDLKILPNYICVLNQKTLYVFDKELNIAYLPMCLGKLYSLLITQDLQVYTISVEGTIRGYNILLRKNFGQANIAPLMEGQPQSDDPIQYMKIDDQQKLFVKLKHSKKQYFIDWSTKIWVKMQFIEGKFIKGNSIRIKNKQQQINQIFFGFNNKLLSQNNLSSIQYSLVYYKKYVSNSKMYYDALINLIKQLINRKMDSQLRTLLYNYFFNLKSEYYISSIDQRQKVWQNVLKIGGKIIQQCRLVYQ